MIVGGDFNCRPQDHEVAMLRALLPELHDSWAAVHPDEPGYTSNAGDQGRGDMHSLQFIHGNPYISADTPPVCHLTCHCEAKSGMPIGILEALLPSGFSAIDQLWLGQKLFKVC